MNPKKHVLDKKIPAAFSITRRLDIAFREKCAEMGLDASPLVESFIAEFLHQQFIHENKPKT